MDFESMINDNLIQARRNNNNMFYNYLVLTLDSLQNLQLTYPPYHKH
jgi:hypothetical protein